MSCEGVLEIRAGDYQYTDADDMMSSETKFELVINAMPRLGALTGIDVLRALRRNSA